MENWKYLVVDLENSGVLYSAPTLTNALNVTAGILNVGILQLPLHREYFAPLNQYDYDNDMLESTKGRHVQPLPTERITEHFLRRREEAKSRGKYLVSIEMLFTMCRERATLSYPSEISAEVDIELGRCRPQEGYYTQGIHEYANVQRVDVSVAYEELKFLVNGARLVKLRNFGLYRRYVQIINSCPLSDLEKNYQLAIDEVYYNAKI
jgi:hypothetical protein